MGRRLVSFDWALKRLLRSKVNFDILEGFLSELLHDDVTILEVLDSESNKIHKRDKFNRVDLKVRNQKGEIIIIEVQADWQYEYFQRVIYGVSKAFTEHIEESDDYNKVIKVISVSILYFTLGKGEDYIYHGTTDIRGLHSQEELQLSDGLQENLKVTKPGALFPEYYFIRVDKFDDVAKNSLDEWIYFLKNEDIKDEFKARGLKAAKDKLDKCRLDDDQRRAYEAWVEDRRCERSTMKSALWLGKQQGKRETAKKLLHLLNDQQISEATGLSVGEIAKLREDE